MGDLVRLRSVLFAPAVRPDHLMKLAQRGADAVVIDCEDATPAMAKSEGRTNAKRYGAELARQGCAVFVRVNSVGSQWFEDDIADALDSALAGVVVPMVETISELDQVADALDAAGFGDLGVFAGLETVRGVADARELVSHDRVEVAYFGAEDFIADIGGRRTSENLEVLHARSAVAMAGHLGSVPVIDQVVTDFRNAKAFAAEASFARDLGFKGKLCIHPGQVELANDAFSPSGAELARAKRLVDAYERGVDAGLAAIDFEGQMVDGPLVAQARTVLALSAELAPTSEGDTGD